MNFFCNNSVIKFVLKNCFTKNIPNEVHNGMCSKVLTNNYNEYSSGMCHYRSRDKKKKKGI